MLCVWCKFSFLLVGISFQKFPSPHKHWWLQQWWWGHNYAQQTWDPASVTYPGTFSQCSSEGFFLSGFLNLSLKNFWSCSFSIYFSSPISLDASRTYGKNQQRKPSHENTSCQVLHDSWRPRGTTSQRWKIFRWAEKLPPYK